MPGCRGPQAWPREVDWLVGWLAGWLASRLAGWQAGSPAAWLAGGLPAALAAWRAVCRHRSATPSADPRAARSRGQGPVKELPSQTVVGAGVGDGVGLLRQEGPGPAAAVSELGRSRREPQRPEAGRAESRGRWGGKGPRPEGGKAGRRPGGGGRGREAGALRDNHGVEGVDGGRERAAEEWRDTRGSGHRELGEGVNGIRTWGGGGGKTRAADGASRTQIGVARRWARRDGSGEPGRGAAGLEKEQACDSGTEQEEEEGEGKVRPCRGRHRWQVALSCAFGPRQDDAYLSRSPFDPVFRLAKPTGGRLTSHACHRRPDQRRRVLHRHEQ